MLGEKIKNIAFFAVAVLGWTALFYLFIRYAFVSLLPFLIGWFIAFAVRRPAAALQKVLRLPERVIRLLLALLLTLGVLGLTGIGIWQLSRELWRIFQSIGESGIEDTLSGIASTDGLIGRLFGELSDTVIKAIYSLVVSLLESLGHLLSAFVGALPGTFLFIIVTVIASVYFSLDLERVNAFVLGVLPPSVQIKLRRFRRSFWSVGAGYLRSYLILMLITFLTMLAGMLLLRMPYALVIALLLAVLDLLPVLGVGTALVPWCIYEFVLGDTSVGIGLILLYLVHTVIRQLAEPRIIGKSLGIHPLVSLLFIYVGYSLFGFAGILVGPLLTVFVQSFIRKDGEKDLGSQKRSTEQNQSS